MLERGYIDTFIADESTTDDYLGIKAEGENAQLAALYSKSDYFVNTGDVFFVISRKSNLFDRRDEFIKAYRKKIEAGALEALVKKYETTR